MAPTWQQAQYLGVVLTLQESQVTCHCEGMLMRMHGHIPIIAQGRPLRVAVSLCYTAWSRHRPGEVPVGVHMASNAGLDIV